MATTSSQVGEYLRARRDVVQPEDVGLVREPNRRVKGLRRDEVALLAGISADYYLRLEQGRDHQPSEQVLQSLGRALQLNEVAVGYLFQLARPFRGTTAEQTPDAVSPGITRLFQRWTHTPAFVADSNLDVVISNALADKVGAGAMSVGTNRLLHLFNDVCRESDPGWRERAEELVAAFRLQGRPESARLQKIVGNLSIQDPTFRVLWAKHDVQISSYGTCFEQVEPFGLLEFEWQNLEVPGHAGHTLTTLFAAPGTAAAGALAFLSAQANRLQTLN